MTHLLDMPSHTTGTLDTDLSSTAIMVSASWTSLLASDELQLSSHVLSVVNGSAYIFGGELLPRQPRDNHVYRLHSKSHGMLCISLV